MNLRRWLPALGVTLIAAGFTWLNRGERAFVDLGVVRFYRAPLTLVVFLAFLAGMLSMLLLSLRYDRRLRAELRARGVLEPEPAGPVLDLRASEAPDDDGDGVAPVPLRLRVEPDPAGPGRAAHDDVTRIHPADDEVARIHPSEDVTRIYPADEPDVTRHPADGYDGRMTRDDTAGRIHPHDDRAP